MYLLPRCPWSRAFLAERSSGAYHVTGKDDAGQAQPGQVGAVGEDGAIQFAAVSNVDRLRQLGAVQGCGLNWGGEQGGDDVGSGEGCRHGREHGGSLWRGAGTMLIW